LTWESNETDICKLLAVKILKVSLMPFNRILSVYTVLSTYEKARGRRVGAEYH